MATPLEDVIAFLVNIGIFKVVLPFLLVFVVVFAILERTKVFGVEKIEGREYTKKNLNSAAAFVIAFLVIASSRLVEIITQVSSQFVVLLFGVVLFLLLVGSFFQEKPEGVFLEGGWKTAFMIIVFIGLLFIFLDALEVWDDVSSFFSGTSTGELVGTIILMVIIVMFMVYVTQDRKTEKKT